MATLKINTFQYVMSYNISSKPNEPLIHNVLHAVGYSKKSDVIDLDNSSIQIILKFMRSQFEIHRKYKLLIVDTTNFPQITSYFDDGSTLSIPDIDVVINRLIEEEPKSIPTVIVNKSSEIISAKTKLVPCPFNVVNLNY